MNFATSTHLKTSILLISMIILLAACGPTDAQKAEWAQQRAEQHKKASQERNSALISASDEELYELLHACRTEVEKKGEKSLTSWILKEHDGDIFQVALGGLRGRIREYESDDYRIETLRQHTDQPSTYLSPLNTRYALYRLQDTFSGPVRIVDRYECHLAYDKRLTIAGVRRIEQTLLR